MGSEFADEQGDEASPGEQVTDIESAVAALTDGAPSDWVRLHAEFGLVKSSATVSTESAADPVSLTVPTVALEGIASHQRRAAEAGRPWHRLIIDYDRSGELSVRQVHDVRATRWILIGLLFAVAIAAAAIAIYLALRLH